MLSRKKSVLIVILLSVIAVLPWLGNHLFYTKGEPREALVPQAMLETGNWILPQRYGDMFATKPPFMHWISALISLPQGDVTEWSARMPVALAGIGIILLTFCFFSKRYSLRTTFLSSLILLTAFEMHRSSMEARVDMPLSFFMVWAILALYRRVEQNFKGSWFTAVCAMTAAVLVKGPVGAVLPLGIYALFMLYRRESIKHIVLEMFKLGPASLILPALWYVAAYQIGGELFWETIYNENFGRFTSTEDMGHKAPIYANITYYLMGLIPWSLLAIAALPELFIRKSGKSHGVSLPLNQRLVSLRNKFNAQPMIIRYAWFVLIIITVFYTIPSGKRSVYLLPAYPFMALLLAQWFETLIEKRSKALLFTAYLLGGMGIVILLVQSMTFLGVIHPANLLSAWGVKGETLYHGELISDLFASFSWIGLFLTLFLAISVATLFYFIQKKKRFALFYAVFAMMFSLNVYLDGYLLPVIKNGMSLKSFALACRKESGEAPLYMPSMNGLRFYVINYYLHNQLKPLDSAFPLPESGYCFVTESDYENFKRSYADKYTFQIVNQTANRYNDVRRKVLFVKFEHTAQ